MGLLETILICVGLFLLFPKGFKFMVGTWVGAMGGGFFWALGLGGAFMAGMDPSWPVMGWSFLGFILVGVFFGCVLAARG